MPLSKIQLKPGVNKEGTRYSAEEGWNDSDKVRFRKGLPEKIGGWKKLSDNTFQGIARSIRTWRTLASKLYIGIGTNLKFYIESGGTYNDITPLRKATITLASGPLRVTSGSNVVRVTDTTGGYRNGDFVTLAGATGPINNIPASELNAEHQIAYTDTAIATAQARIASSSDATLDCDNLEFTISGESIIAGMVVSGTGITTGTTVASVTSDGGSGDNVVVLEMSAPMSVLEDADITFTHANSYTITTSTSASGGSTAAGGGSSVTATYQINSGDEIEIAEGGWGGGGWSGGAYGTGLTSDSNIRLWSQANFGEDLILAYRGGPLYYWFGANTLTTLAVELNNKDTITATKNGNSGGATTTFAINAASVRSGSAAIIQVGMLVEGTGAAGVVRVATVTDQQNLILDTAVDVSDTTAITFKYDVPAKVNRVLVSDISRFVFCFGTTAYLDDSYVMDPLLLRWSDQEDASDWIPTTTNLAGSLRLSRGGEIITAVQARQEILVWTDAALYNLQFLGADGWGAQLVGENTSIASPNAVAYANGIAFWMGRDKFYTYDGNVKPLPCTLHRHVFDDINGSQLQQITAGTNEAFNEVWWFYPKTETEENDRYVVYNYLENLWYHGTDIKRSAWEDSGIRNAPIAATVTTKNIVEHEIGNDDDETSTSTAITASITSGEFDIQDGNQMSFVWRMLPDLTFTGSDAVAPSATLTLNPLKSSGSGYNSPLSEGGSNSGTVTQGTTVTVEPYTTQIGTRIRGRQMSLKVESTELGVKWQLGYPRIDMRPDGRR